MKKLVSVALTLLTIACSPGRHSTMPSGTQQISSSSTQDGSTYENAVIIKERSETAGISAEYKWIREHYPGSKNKMQALEKVNHKSYDVLTIETADGVEKKIYFDISKFFGKG